METTLDSSGRIAIPQTILEHFHLKPGMTLKIEETSESLVLKPVVSVSSANPLLTYAGTLTETDAGNILTAIKQHRINKELEINL